ncbi:MAG: type IV pili methyl-accepting chemotaxis transducer N-terminal domain-containing protein, partial [Pseudomonadota bacterium]
SGEYSGEDAEIVFTRNVPLLKKMNEVVSFVEQVYANPNEMLLGTAVAINIAGRQRMLSQKIGKEVCQIALGWRAEDVADTLKKTINLFETSHGALANGMAAAGVLPPPTPEIADALTAFEARWAGMKTFVTGLMEGQPVDREALAVFARENDVLLKEMHAIVGMYEKA